MEIKKLIEYMIWADNIYYDYCLSLDKESIDQKQGDFNKSIRDIITHIFEVCFEWYDLILENEWRRSDIDNKTPIIEIIDKIKKLSHNFIEYIETKDVTKSFKLQWSSDDTPVITTAENIIFNFVTHSAYHRGQLALLLRNLGFKEIKETDFNPYIYEKAQQ